MSFLTPSRLRTVTLMALISGLIGFVAYRLALRHEVVHANLHFQRYLTEQSGRLEQGILAATARLEAIRSVYESETDVPRETFAALARDVLIEHEEVLAVEWIPRVPGEQRGSHEIQARREGLSGYRITQRVGQGEMSVAGPRKEYFPVLYVEPEPGNEEALGFDVASNRIRRTALRRAWHTDRLALSDPIVLVQEKGTSKAVLALVPVTRSVAASAAGEPPELRGFVVGVFRIDELVRHVLLQEIPGQAFYRLVDDEVDGRSRDLYCSIPRAEFEDGSRVFEKRVEIGGQRWNLCGRPTLQFLHDHSTELPAIIGLGVFLTCALVAGLVGYGESATRDAVLNRQTRVLRSAVRSLSEGVVVADRSGRFLLANSAAREMSGIDLEGVPPREWARVCGLYLPDRKTLYPPDRLPLVRAIQGEDVSDVEIFVHNDRVKERWLSVSGAPLRDERGAIHGGVVLFRDITKRKNAEGVLERLSSAVEQAEDAVFITDRDGRIQYANPAFTTRTGYDLSEARGKTPRILRSGRHDDAYYKALWATILAGDAYRGTIYNRRKNGDVYMAQQTITPIKDSAGHVTHFVTVSTDVTERRLREEQELELRLAARVQQRLYPEGAPQIAGLDIAGAVSPAQATCGDYYDFVAMPDDVLGVVIGDVSGHGFGPALLMAETRAYLRSLATVRSDQGEMLTIVNEALAKDMEDNLYVTLLMTAIDVRNRKLRFLNAGHLPGYVLSGSGNIKAELGAAGPPLGMFQGERFPSPGEIELDPGDLLLLFTDGVTETEDPRGVFFGTERVLGVVRRNLDRPAREIVSCLHEAVHEFSESEFQRDDVTTVLCRLQGLP